LDRFPSKTGREAQELWSHPQGEFGHHAMLPDGSGVAGSPSLADGASAFGAMIRNEKGSR
jgi:hypothetical protein